MPVRRARLTPNNAVRIIALPGEKTQREDQWQEFDF